MWAWPVHAQGSVQCWVSSGLVRRRHSVCSSCIGGTVKSVSRKQASIHSSERLCCLHFSKRWGQHCQGCFPERHTLCVTPSTGEKSKAGREKNQQSWFVLSAGPGLCWSFNQSLLLEISISSRGLKPNIHPALHENEQGRSNSGH